MGRAQGKNAAVASSDSFGVLGRRGSTQAQVQRDRAELQHRRVQLLNDIAEELLPQATDYATVTNLVLDSAIAPEGPFYGELLDAVVKHLRSDEYEVALASAALNDLLEWELLIRQDGDFVIRALERYIETVPEIGGDASYALICAIHRTGKKQRVRGHNDRLAESLGRLAATYAQRLREERATLLAQATPDKRLYRLRSEVPLRVLRDLLVYHDFPDNTNLTPLVTVVCEDLESGLFESDPRQLREMAALMRRLLDSGHPGIPAVTAALDTAVAHAKTGA